MNAFFIIPAGGEGRRRAVRHSPAAREAPRGAGRRSRGRWAGPSPSRWACATFCSAGRSSEAGAGDRIFALSTARITLDTELGLQPAGVAGVCFKPLSAGEFVRAENELQELLDGRRRDPLEGRAQDRRPRLRVDHRPRRRARGPRHDRALIDRSSRSAGSTSSCSRPSSASRAYKNPRLLDLRLQARGVLAVCPDRHGQGARQRQGARAQGAAREGAPDRARDRALVRPVRRAGLGGCPGERRCPEPGRAGPG